MSRHATAIALAVLCLAAPRPAAAASCADHETIVARLAEGYGETRQAIALSSDGAVVEIFASPETGTWTITVTHPGRPTCLVAAGESFQPVEESLPARGDGA